MKLDIYVSSSKKKKNHANFTLILFIRMVSYWARANRVAVAQKKFQMASELSRRDCIVCG